MKKILALVLALSLALSLTSAFAAEKISVIATENPHAEVMELIAEGRSTKEIAKELFITTGTVRNYISTILDKLEASNRIEAIARYREKS